MSDADNWRLQNELGWHDDRGNMLRFLDDPSIDSLVKSLCRSN